MKRQKMTRNDLLPTRADCRACGGGGEGVWACGVVVVLSLTTVYQFHSFVFLRICQVLSFLYFFSFHCTCLSLGWVGWQGFPRAGLRTHRDVFVYQLTVCTKHSTTHMIFGNADRKYIIKNIHKLAIDVTNRNLK